MKKELSIKVKERIESLIDFPNIYNYVTDNWGTVRLKLFIEKLMEDTRNDTRKGFPLKTVQSLAFIGLENIKYLESIGVSFEDDYLSGFAVSPWKIPKNF